MPSQDHLEPVTAAGVLVLERLWQLYRHDMSEFTGSWPDQNGLFRATRLHAYLEDERCDAYLLRYGAAPAGFVTVRVLPEPKRIGDFFVIRRVRGLGAGRHAALAVIRARPGDWEIAFQDSNTRAARFWRRIATEVAGDQWREEHRPVPGKPHVPPDAWIMFRSP